KSRAIALMPSSKSFHRRSWPRYSLAVDEPGDITRNLDRTASEHFLRTHAHKPCKPLHSRFICAEFSKPRSTTRSTHFVPTCIQRILVGQIVSRPKSLQLSGKLKVQIVKS